METWIWILIIAVAVVIVVVTLIAMARRARRRTHLKDRFGPEYDRTVDALDSRRQAENDLRTREEQHALLNLQPLAPADRERYQARWADMQSNFVERPQVAVADADSMITQVMRDLGYPVDDFESNAWLVSVEHANVVAKYREGHEIYNRTVAGTATTEDLRQAVLAYRELFNDLMRESADAEQRS
ncbi:MAG TPA: hypothetical protein VM282_03265 [Acidimicrobiales bacterium]|nr:hypothetical protein [Acidimicrobiales bacterium]